MNDINEKDLKSVSGGVDIDKVSSANPTPISKIMHPECPKCGKEMTRQDGYAYPGPDGKLRSKVSRTYCPHCGYDASGTSIDNQKD